MTLAPGGVYLDWNATAPLAAAARAVLQSCLDADLLGNPSSLHSAGRRARTLLEEARRTLAGCLETAPEEIVFTSGGTEANALFLRGAAALMEPGLIAVSAVEHSSVYETARLLAAHGWRLVEIPVDAEGRIDPLAFERILRERPAIVSVMLAHNETGVIQDVASLARAAREAGALVHCDAVQAVGKMPLSRRALGVHALTLSGHKFGAPTGIGALVLAREVALAPLLTGGGQEAGRRSGTENVPGAMAMAAALVEALEARESLHARLHALQQRLEAGLAAQGAVIFGAGAARLPNTTFFALPGLEGAALASRLDRAGFAVGTGSACSSGEPGAPRSLLAMGVPEALARGAVRVSTGSSTTEADIDGFLAALAQAAGDLRRLAALCAD
ncbi:MAG: cysteine desulfurase [Tepidiphilus sp.]|nr:cysteine desulfurase [Tepidiphilus sp.]